MYFLNTTGTLYNPSSYVADLIVNKLYRGQPVLLNDTLKGLTEHIWRNNLPFYPSSIFASSNSTYSSGTQQLDNLKIELARDIRRLKPGALESHLDKKTEEATKNTRKCESCKD